MADEFDPEATLSLGPDESSGLPKGVLGYGGKNLTGGFDTYSPPAGPFAESGSVDFSTMTQQEIMDYVGGGGLRSLRFQNLSRGVEFPPQLYRSLRVPFGSIPGANKRRYNLRAAIMFPSHLDRDSYQQLQVTLWRAGYYGQDALTGNNGAGQPAWGDQTDVATQDAWLSLLQDSIQLGNVRLDELLARKTEQFAPTLAQANQLEPLQDRTITVEDPAAIRTWLDQNSQDIIGRKLDDADKEMMVQLIHGKQIAAQQQAIDVDQRNEREDKGYNDPRPGDVPGTFPKYFDPTGVSAAAQAIAARFGLQVGGQWRTQAQNNAIYGKVQHSDHVEGMAVDFTGPKENMEAMAAWASQNEGRDGALFRWVGWKDDSRHFDHVHLSFNPENNGMILGAEGMQMMSGQPAGASDLDRFMAAIRAVESGGRVMGQADYDVTNGIGAKGAYQFMPDTWRGVNAEFGGDASDWSPAHQDDMARRKMMQYYQQFGDWQSVAVAWFAGPGRVAAYNAGRANHMSDGNATVPEYVSAIMELMGQPMSPNGNTTIIEDVDVASQLEQEIRDRFPTETGAHDVAKTFSDFLELLGGTDGGGGSSASNISGGSI